MNNDKKKLLIVGDNPFHGISHLSQERARDRKLGPKNVEIAAEIVLASLENGANGFMFSVSETTLSALKLISERTKDKSAFELYAIVPYAYEYVRIATHLGTVGLIEKLAKEIIISKNLGAMTSGFRGVAGMDVTALTKAYLLYEISRIKRAMGNLDNLKSVLLHEVITEMALALDLDWLVKAYIRIVSKLGIQPGFETRNFAYLTRKFKAWNIDISKLSIVAPFNAIGFQMNPSKVECEKALSEIPQSNVIAMSILAAGYLKLPEAIDYTNKLPNLSGVVVGVSEKKQAFETFSLLKERISTK